MGPTMCVLLGADDSITKIQMDCIAKLQLKLQKMDHFDLCAAPKKIGSVAKLQMKPHNWATDFDLRDSPRRLTVLPEYSQARDSDYP